MAKTRVGVLLRETMSKSGSAKSTDLEKLTSEYHIWCKKINVLVQALKTHLGCLQRVQKSRCEVAKCFSDMAKDTPLFDSIGLLPSEERPANTVCSYSSIHVELGAKTTSYCAKFKEFVLDYAIEWEKIVRTRIDNGLKKAEEMRRDLDHYQKKVEALRLSTNQSLAKGKSVGSSTQEKLQRNEEKFLNSKQNYNRVATDLVILMEEVTERSWRDLHPLLIKCAQFDMTLSSDEAKALSSLTNVVNVLKNVANDKGISPQPRLKDLGSLKPELLSTRPGGVSGLQIDYGGPMNGAPTSQGGAYGETALPPGSVGPQGLGGFPVTLTPTATSGGANDIYRSTSFNSNHSAPAMQLDPLAGMNSLTISSNNPSSYASPSGAPGMPQPNNWNPSYRSTSFADDHSAYSGYSGYSAPPSSAPPMPPSMPPPPPPGSGGGYGLPPMAPINTSQSYGMGSGGVSTPSYNTSPWSQPSPDPMSFYGNQQMPQDHQTRRMSASHDPYNPSQPSPQANPGYNPFG